MGFFDRKAPNSFALKPPEYYFSDQKTQALLKAATAGDLVAARQAVAAGADPNASGTVQPGSNFGFSPLHYALAADSPEAIRVLGSFGADPERRVPNMGMPFLFAITLNNDQLLAFLFAIKPVLQCQEATKQHLLFESARRNAPGCLELLVNNGVPVDLKDTAGYTLLLRSIEMNELDLTIWLLDRGAEVDVVTLNGMTPAYSIEYELNTRTPKNSRKEAQVHEIIGRMKEKGARFPALAPAQELARQGRGR